MVNIGCVVCGKTWKEYPAKAKTRKFCSNTCANKPGVKKFPKRDQWGPKNPSWKGGRIMSSKGYVLVNAPHHPRQHNGYVLEHILVAERIIGRPLYKNEQVHHVNEKKDDNRPSNLQVLTALQHMRIHRGHKKPQECLKLECKKKTKKAKFCSRECARKPIKWISDDNLIQQYEVYGVSTRKLAKMIGGVSHVGVWKRIKTIQGSLTGKRGAVNTEDESANLSPGALA